MTIEAPITKVSDSCYLHCTVGAQAWVVLQIRVNNLVGKTGIKQTHKKTNVVTRSSQCREGLWERRQSRSRGRLGQVMFAAKLKPENHIGERETSGAGAARPSMEKVHP